jgi:undecaprenyl-diphosphatase
MNDVIIFIAAYFVFVLAAVALLYFLKQPRQKQKEFLFFAAMLLPLSYLAAKVGGYLYFDPRPFVTQNVTPLILHPPDNGFPSDHTLLGAAIAAVVFRFNHKTGVLLFFFALLIGWARVLAGMHNPIDVAGSIIIVVIIYLILNYFLLPLVSTHNLNRNTKTSI